MEAEFVYPIVELRDFCNHPGAMSKDGLVYPRSSLLVPRSSILVPRCTNKRLGTVLEMVSPKQFPVQSRSEETTNKRLETHPEVLA